MFHIGSPSVRFPAPANGGGCIAYTAWRDASWRSELRLVAFAPVAVVVPLLSLSLLLSLFLLMTPLLLPNVLRNLRSRQRESSMKLWSEELLLMVARVGVGV